MHTLHVISSTDTGGAEIMLLKLLKCLRDQSPEQTHAILCLNSKGDLQSSLEEYTTNIWNLPPRRTLIDGPKIVSEIRQSSPHLLVGWMYRSLILTCLLRLFIKAKVIWTVRQSIHRLSDEPWATRMMIWGSKILSRFPDTIIYNSQEALAQHQKRGFAKCGVVIPNGFSSSQFYKSSEKREQTRTSLSIPKEAYLIGVVARYNPCKGHSDLIAAAHEILKAHPKAQFLFVGRGFSSPPAVLRGQIEALGLTNIFHFSGQVRDTREIYNALDLLISPSLVEGFSNTIGEALFCHVPTLCLDAGDSPFIVDDPLFVFPKENPPALAQAVKTLLTLDDTQRVERLEKMFFRAQRLFDIETVSKAYNNAFQGEK